ncbi:SpoVR family protein [Shigella boydii]|nr:SpoVR family protein [Shigella boydii]
MRGDRSLTLRYIPHNRAPLDRGRKEVLKHVHRLWGFDVMLEQQNEDGKRRVAGTLPAKNGKSVKTTKNPSFEGFAF